VPKARFERDGLVGVVVIDDPPLNLFGAEMIDDISSAAAEAAQSDIRALLIRAEGKYFTGGVDVRFVDDKTRVDRGAALRHRGPAARGQDVSRPRTGQGQLRGPLI
jgi:enoyl-CoA hydratase/carnithine racemase